MLIPKKWMCKKFNQSDLEAASCPRAGGGGAGPGRLPHRLRSWCLIGYTQRERSHLIGQGTLVIVPLNHVKVISSSSVSRWFPPGPGDFVLDGAFLEEEKPELLGVLGVDVFEGAVEREALALHSGERERTFLHTTIFILLSVYKINFLLHSSSITASVCVCVCAGVCVSHR